MKVVQIRGGLGNQMFQYAFAVALTQRFPNDEVYIDTHLYKYPVVKSYKGNNFYHNGFEIDNIFPNAQLPIANWFQVAKVSYYFPNYLVSRAIRKVFHPRQGEYVQEDYNAFLYEPRVMEEHNFTYYDGYWQSYKYFDKYKQKIWDTFQFTPFDTSENNELAKQLNSSNSVTIHIRRGDYLNHLQYQNICTLDYYRKCIIEAKKVIDFPSFYIFSNDQEWCKQNLSDLFEGSPVSFITNNRGKNSYRDMQLMSLARCNILANSSFSWWGAYLNQRENHIVYTPQKWVNIPCDDVCCKEWVKV